MTNCTIFFLILIKKDEGAVSFTENIVSITLFIILNVYTFNFPLEKRIYMNLEISDIVILLSEDKEAEPIVKKTFLRRKTTTDSVLKSTSQSNFRSKQHHGTAFR